MRVNKVFGIFICLIAFTGCNGKLSPREYMQWMEKEDHGFHKKKETGAVVFEIQYKSPEYLQIQSNDMTAPESNEGNTLVYFGLRLSPSDGNTPVLQLKIADRSEYQARMDYYAFRFRSDIHANINGRQVSCDYFIPENNGNIRPDLDFTLGFDVGNEKGDIQVVITDRVFGNGEIKFLFKEEQFKKIPSIDFKS